ncbi:MAG: hypothetical protein K2M46_05005 [Lachnospiraceae bacterium]|nr:hypothetical protein [Lachnospiraceae bacterium]
MEISNAYSSYVSNSTYATKSNNQKQTTESSITDKASTETQSSTRKTAADELSYLSKKYSNYSFVAANYSRGIKYGSNSTTNVAISPQFLSKMASDPELEKEYEKNIAAMQECDEQNVRSVAAGGWHVVAQGWAIDKDGGISKWSIVQKDDTKSHLQTMSENAEKIRKQNEEKKKERADIEERRQSSKEEAELKEKLKEAGETQFGSKYKDTIVIVQNDNGTDSSKNEKDERTAVGINLDMKI